MAIDTAVKRRAALGRSVAMLPAPTGTIDTNVRAILTRLYLLYVPVSIVTPASRIYAIARTLRIYAIAQSQRIYSVR